MAANPVISEADANHSDPYASLAAKRTQFLSFVRSRISKPEIAEDILQEALLKALEAKGSLRLPARIEAWFYRVLRNVVIDHYRRSAVAARTFVEEHDGIASVAAVGTVNVCPCVGRELSSLKKEYASVLEQVDMQGDPVRDFARREDIAANNASLRLHRARRALRRRVMAACGACADSGCFDCTCA